MRKETIHNQHRRAFCHDYCEKGLYMLTLVVEGRQPVFGHIAGTTEGKPGTDEAPHVVLTELGRRVMEEEIQKISRFYPMAEVWRVAIMPDHIHLLVRIKEALPEGKHLGIIVSGFKSGCTRAWWSLTAPPEGEPSGTTAQVTAQAATSRAPQAATGTAPQAATGTAPQAATGTGAQGATGRAAVPEGSPSGAMRPVLFQKGYHDRIINRPGMLENIKRYMAENPLRARIRQECPKLMERQLHLWIAGREYAAFGNLFLLKYPLKQQVFFHRKDAATGQPTETTEAYQQERRRLLCMAEEGTVLVTPGISKGESLIVSDAIDARLPLIILQKEPIGEYWKPSQRRFYACASGHLLILAPWQNEGHSDYARFHHLNDLAKEICSATEMRIVNYSRLK